MKFQDLICTSYLTNVKRVIQHHWDTQPLTAYTEFVREKNEILTTALIVMIVLILTRYKGSENPQVFRFYQSDMVHYDLRSSNDTRQ